MASSVQVYLPSYGYTYSFTGVLSVKHEYSLKLQTDSSSASGDDYINRARYLPAPDQWVISVWDSSSGELMINQIPLICSYGQVNDLLLPFQHLREGRGMGSLFVIRDTDETSTPNPAKGNLTEYRALWGNSI